MQRHHLPTCHRPDHRREDILTAEGIDVKEICSLTKILVEGAMYLPGITEPDPIYPDDPDDVVTVF